MSDLLQRLEKAGKARAEEFTSEWGGGSRPFIAGHAELSALVVELAEAIIGGTERGGVFWRENALSSLEAYLEGGKNG